MNHTRHIQCSSVTTLHFFKGFSVEWGIIRPNKRQLVKQIHCSPHYREKHPQCLVIKSSVLFIFNTPFISLLSFRSKSNRFLDEADIGKKGVMDYNSALSGPPLPPGRHYQLQHAQQSNALLSENQNEVRTQLQNSSTSHILCNIVPLL